MSAYSEKEMFNIWSRMDHKKHYRMICTMSQLFGLSKDECEKYDCEFTNIRNKRIYEER